MPGEKPRVRKKLAPQPFPIPPKPMFEITISSPEDPSLAYTCDALHDTGTDITLIPQEIASKLGLIPINSVEFRGVDRQQVISGYVSTANITIESAIGPILTDVVVPDLEDCEVLLGRNLMGQFTITTIRSEIIEIE